MGIENPVHLLFLAVVALVVLGPKRLPELARAAGRGMREFRAALSGEDDQVEDAVAVEDPGYDSFTADAAARDVVAANDPVLGVGSPDAPDRRPL